MMKMKSLRQNVLNYCLFLKSKSFLDPGLIDLNSNITHSHLDSSLPLHLKENNRLLAQCSSLMSIADSYNKTQPTNSSFITTSNHTTESTLSISTNKFFKTLEKDTVNPAKAENSKFTKIIPKFIKNRFESKVSRGGVSKRVNKKAETKSIEQKFDQI